MLPQPEDKIFNYQKFLQNPIWSQRHFNTSSADALLLCSPKTPPVILAAAFFFGGKESPEGFVSTCIDQLQLGAKFPPFQK